MATEVTLIIRDDYGLTAEHWEQEIEDIIYRLEGCTLVEVNIEEDI